MLGGIASGMACWLSSAGAAENLPRTKKPLMSYVDVLAVEVLDNPAKFKDDLKFKITFQCKIKPQEDLEWRITWVGSAKNEKFDQLLDEVQVPPEVGVNSFEYIVDAPDPDKVPPGELLGVTVVMVQALYRGKEFVRVGYYVKVDYADEKLREEPPEVDRPDPELLERTILDAEPRVTRYLIEWDDAPCVAPSAAEPGSESAGCNPSGGEDAADRGVDAMSGLTGLSECGIPPSPVCVTAAQNPI